MNEKNTIEEYNPDEYFRMFGSNVLHYLINEIFLEIYNPLGYTVGRETVHCTLFSELHIFARSSTYSVAVG